MEELLTSGRPKHAVEEVLGRAKLLKQFSTRKDMHVVGGKVQEGNMVRGAQVRVHRRTAVIGVGKIKNMQANKADVDRVPEGNEFGAQIESNFEMAPGDMLECFSTTMK